MGESLIIYWDILWIINFMMDAILLSITGAVLRLPIRPLRLALAAFLGATLSLAFLWYSAGIVLTWVMKLLLGGLMVKTAFSLQGWRKTLQAWSIFYLSAWVAGGILYSLAPSETGIGTFWFLLLLAAALTAAGMLLWRQARQKGAWQAELTVHMPGGVSTIRALIDSGNRLVDPLTGAPVIVVEQDSLDPFLPDGWKENSIASESPLSPRFIPYKSIGNPDGLILGFRPLRVELRSAEGRKMECTGALIGITRQKLDPSGQYRALVPDAWGW
ncbi:sigma-E processing peptidase SpoIIGA [Heliobacterium chlorum]|uniref:Sporulation sigma-E factor-processing peptidase n=1 Tax=Heliobacterium chlorum TaxID=2698 RepID=A0ABR7SXJ2_HELCL|nr:sigma-E processing peptidase SpoIIGA [Heliobacterium chlorum]MBC9783259.1 sigma-E processing peptidase SpoIIGA [Heliobacterium chlorum]